MPRKEPTERYQAGPTLNGAWQVLDLATGEAVQDDFLQMDRLSREQALSLSQLLNKLEAQESFSATDQQH
jgi:hypothetical protein